jgi:hypothetical protein
VRSAYRAHIARLFALAGEGGGEPAADNIITLEAARLRACNGRGVEFRADGTLRNQSSFAEPLT